MHTWQRVARLTKVFQIWQLSSLRCSINTSMASTKWKKNFNLISRMWFQLMRLVMVLFNAHFSFCLPFQSFHLIRSPFIRLCAPFCILPLHHLQYLWRAAANDNRSAKRINSHEQYAFEHFVVQYELPLNIVTFFSLFVVAVGFGYPFIQWMEMLVFHVYQMNACVRIENEWKASRWHGKNECWFALFFTHPGYIFRVFVFNVRTSLCSIMLILSNWLELT